MADNIQYITFNQTIPANGAGANSTLTGTLQVDYTTMTVSRTLTAQTPTSSETFSPTSVQMRPQDNGQYLITVGGGRNPENSITIFYNGQDPSQVRTAYLVDGTTYGNTNATNGQTQMVSSSPTPPVCFVKGTLIRTTRGDVRVEDLNIGDECITSSGAARPVRWLGHRDIRCARYEERTSVLPIRIAASAFGDQRPSRDLYLSPGHSICVDVFGEILIPASSLINGSTITQEQVEDVSYWHVELDSHDIVMAENLPCESYLEMDNRGFFVEHGLVDLMSMPDADVRGRDHSDFCRPFHVDGAIVDAVRARLEAIAQNLPVAPADTGEAKAALALVA